MQWHIQCYKIATGKEAKIRPNDTGAKYEGTCALADCALGGLIHKGDPFAWRRTGGRRNAGARTATEAYNDAAENSDQDEECDTSDGTPKQDTYAHRKDEAHVPSGNPLAAAILPFILPEIESRIDKANARVDIPSIVAAVLAQVGVARDVRIQINQLPPVDCGRQHKTFKELVQLLSCRDEKTGRNINVWANGPAGSGKTTAAINAAKSLNTEFFYTGAINDPTLLTGYRDVAGNYVSSLLRQAWEFGGFFLWDDIDSSDPNALLAFMALLANGHAAFPDRIVPRHENCYIMAGANTLGLGATSEYCGRLKQDGAFMDRFAPLFWGYDEDLESETCGNREWSKRVQHIRAKVAERGLRSVLITPRASYSGALMLAGGFSQDRTEEILLKSRMSDDQWKQVSA